MKRLKLLLQPSYCTLSIFSLTTNETNEANELFFIEKTKKNKEKHKKSKYYLKYENRRISFKQKSNIQSINEGQNKARISGVDKFFEDFKQLGFSYFTISVFVDGHDELVDMLAADFLISSSQGLESISNEVVDFLVFQCSTVISVVLHENGVDGLFELIIGRSRCHIYRGVGQFEGGQKLQKGKFKIHTEFVEIII